MDYFAILPYFFSMSKPSPPTGSPEVQKLLDALAGAFRVKITLFSAAMEEWAVGLNNPGSQYCRLVQSPLKKLHLCRAMDRDMCLRARTLGRPTAYRCHAGLMETILPITRDGETLGYLMVGQFRDGGGTPVLSPGDSAPGITEAWDTVPVLEGPTRDHLLSLCAMLVDFLVTRDLLATARGPVMEAAAQIIRKRLEEPLTLAQVAAEVGRSPSTLAHLFKEKTGAGFTRYLTLRRVERFEEQIRRNPGVEIREAAAGAGFPDPLYFSRIYRQLRGQAPSRFRAETAATQNS